MALVACSLFVSTYLASLFCLLDKRKLLLLLLLHRRVVEGSLDIRHALDTLTGALTDSAAAAATEAHLHEPAPAPGGSLALATHSLGENTGSFWFARFRCSLTVAQSADDDFRMAEAALLCELLL